MQNNFAAMGGYIVGFEQIFPSELFCVAGCVNPRCCVVIACFYFTKLERNRCYGHNGSVSFAHTSPAPSNITNCLDRLCESVSLTLLNVQDGRFDHSRLRASARRESGTFRSFAATFIIDNEQEYTPEARSLWTIRACCMHFALLGCNIHLLFPGQVCTEWCKNQMTVEEHYKRKGMEYWTTMRD